MVCGRTVPMMAIMIISTPDVNGVVLDDRATAAEIMMITRACSGSEPIVRGNAWTI